MHFTILRTIQQQPFNLVPMKVIKSVSVGTCRVRLVIGKTRHQSVPQLALPRSGLVGNRQNVPEPIVIKEAINTTSTVVEISSLTTEHQLDTGGEIRCTLPNPRVRGKIRPRLFAPMKQPSGPLPYTNPPISECLKNEWNAMQFNAKMPCKGIWYLPSTALSALLSHLGDWVTNKLLGTSEFSHVFIRGDGIIGLKVLLMSLVTKVRVFKGVSLIKEHWSKKTRLLIYIIMPSKSSKKLF
jgi:hypothetical protein